MLLAAGKSLSYSAEELLVIPDIDKLKESIEYVT